MDSSNARSRRAKEPEPEPESEPPAAAAGVMVPVPAMVAPVGGTKLTPRQQAAADKVARLKRLQPEETSLYVEQIMRSKTPDPGAVAAAPKLAFDDMCGETGDEILLKMCFDDLKPEIAKPMRAMEPALQALVLQCVYYAHMFFVLREKAIQRRIRIEKKKKRSLSSTFAGQEERQDDYLARREKLMAQFEVDNAGDHEAQQVAQIDAVIESLQATLAKEGSDVRVGIIGGGRVGLALLRALLHCGTFSPDRIRLSTRRPEELLDYQAQGVECVYDNVHVAQRSEVIFLCCLPAHLPKVAKDLKEAGKSRAQLLMVSVLAGIPAEKIQNMLEVGCVLRPIVNPALLSVDIEAAHEQREALLLAKEQEDPAAVDTAFKLPEDDPMAPFDHRDVPAMVRLAAAQITSNKQNIYTILFALQRWCESMGLDVKEARQIALFCIVGEPERGVQPLTSFHKRFLWTLRNLPELRGHEDTAAALADMNLHADPVHVPPVARRARSVSTTPVGGGKSALVSPARRSTSSTSFH
eukprot:COSAG05_NODE_1145_length_5733_cov_3.986865_3_plen_525_part_00